MRVGERERERGKGGEREKEKRNFPSNALGGWELRSYKTCLLACRMGGSAEIPITLKSKRSNLPRNGRTGLGSCVYFFSGWISIKILSGT